MSRIVITGLANDKPIPLLFEPSSSKVAITNNQFTSIDLEDLSRLSNLEILDLSNNELEEIDLGPLENCYELTTLNLAGNDLVDVDLGPLSNCRKLSWISLSGNKMQSLDLSPLRTCSELEYLYLAGNDFQSLDISPLAQIERLREIGLSDDSHPIFADIENALDLRPLLSLRRLKKLELSKNDYVTLGLTAKTHQRRPRGLSECIQKSKFVSVKKLVHHSLHKQGIRNGLESIESEINALNASYWYSVRKHVLNQLGLGIIAGYDGNIFELVPASANQEDNDWIDEVIAKVSDAISEGMSTVLFDLQEISDELPSHGKLKAAILQSRAKEIKNATIIECEKCIDLREVWFTAWGFQLLKEEGFWIFGTSGNHLIEVRNRLQNLGFGLTIKSIKLRDDWPEPRNRPNLKIRQAILGYVDANADMALKERANNCINKTRIHPLRIIVEELMTELYGGKISLG